MRTFLCFSFFFPCLEHRSKNKREDGRKKVAPAVMNAFTLAFPKGWQSPEQRGARLGRPTLPTPTTQAL